MISWNKIILSILLILSITVPELKSEKALVIEVSPFKVHFVDLGNDQEEKFSRILTACPASTKKEKEFDERVSLTGNSLFARKYYQKSEYVKNIKQNICNRPFKPTMVYDFESSEYEIGYEIYYEDGKEITFNSDNETYYHRYRPVKSTKTQNDYEIMNQISPPRDLAIRYEDGKEWKTVKFNFTDGSRTLIFYWLPALKIKQFGDKKRISSQLIYWQKWRKPYTRYLPNRCKLYDSTDENIYSEKNQQIYLKDILTPESGTQINHETKSCGQVYGCLVNSQIAPLQYFETHAERYASCSNMNMIPVWKTIVEGQLKKVDAYTMAMDHPLHPYKVFGVSGILKMKKTTNPNEPQEIFLSDPTNGKIIPIPKIIYRIIDHRCLRRLDDAKDPHKFEEHRYAAAIIIHNNPSPINDEDRFCSRESALSGWDKITNEDSRTGLTYVCPVTVELNDQLGAYDNVTSDTMFDPLNLTAVPYSYLSHWNPNEPIFYQNHTSEVDVEFERIFLNEFA